MEKEDRNTFYQSRTLGIRARFLLVFFGLVVLPTAVFIGLLTRNYYNYALNSLVEEKYSALQQIVKNLDTQLLNFQDISMMFYHNNKILSFINDGDYSEPSPDVQRYLNSLVNTSGDLIAANLYLENGEIYCSGSILLHHNEFHKKYLPEIMKLKGKSRFVPTHIFSTNYQPDIPAFALARIINDQNGPVGCLWLTISANFFNDVLQEPNLIADGTVVYILEGNKVVASSDITLTGRLLDDAWIDKVSHMEDGYFSFTNSEKELVIAVSSVNRADWQIATATPRETILQASYNILRTASIIFLLYILFVLIMYLMLSRMLFRPLAELSRGMRKVSAGDFAHRIPRRTTTPEIDNLAETYNDMAAKIQTLMESVREHEQAKNRETIKVLSMQIGSHFLFNTLGTIKWMAVINKQPQIKRMITALTKLLMSVTYHTGEEISLREELTLVDNYAIIQQARYANFKIEYRVPEELMDLRVSKLILQPVIENCILHGFSGQGIGTIVVDAAIEQDMLLIDVCDDGVGFNTDKLELEKSEDDRIDHVGLHNINQRLKLNYGDQYGIKVTSEVGKGTKVTLLLPIRTEMDEIEEAME